MTDKVLLESYNILHGMQSGTPLLGYAIPITPDVVTLYNVNDKPVRTMTLDALIQWALDNDLVVDAPMEYSPDDTESTDKLSALLQREMAEKESQRLKDISDCLSQIARILGK